MRSSSHGSLILAGLSLFAFATTAWAQGPTDLFLGTNAGNPGVSTGPFDTAIGVNCMAALTSGNSNTGLGYNSLLSCTIGSANTALGAFSQNDTIAGSANTSVGAGSLSANTGGGGNTVVGTSAMSRNTTGGNNVAVGLNALFLSTGDSNTAVGTNALAGTTGTKNIALGLSAGSLIASGSNNIHIGHPAPGNESDTIRIGKTQTTAYLAGVSGVTVASGVQVFVDANGQLGTLTSSARFKEDVADMAGASHPVMQLHPVTFRYKTPYDDGSRRLQYGLIAEEVAKVDPELVQFDSNGQAQTVRYHVVNMMLLNEVQRQEAEVGALRALADRQRGELDQQKQLLAGQGERLQKLEALLARQAPASKP
jgi:hypothetical protein